MSDIVELIAAAGDQECTCLALSSEGLVGADLQQHLPQLTALHHVSDITILSAGSQCPLISPTDAPTGRASGLESE